MVHSLICLFLTFTCMNFLYLISYILSGTCTYCIPQSFAISLSLSFNLSLITHSLARTVYLNVNIVNHSHTHSWSLLLTLLTLLKFKVNAMDRGLMKISCNDLAYKN